MAGDVFYAIFRLDELPYLHLAIATRDCTQTNLTQAGKNPRTDSHYL
jgi:hypothetical protein